MVTKNYCLFDLSLNIHLCLNHLKSSNNKQILFLFILLVIGLPGKKEWNKKKKATFQNCLEVFYFYFRTKKIQNKVTFKSNKTLINAIEFEKYKIRKIEWVPLQPTTISHFELQKIRFQTIKMMTFSLLLMLNVDDDNKHNINR